MNLSHFLHKLGLAAIVLICSTSSYSQDVYWSPVSLDEEDQSAHIEYAAWVWSQRTGMDVEYVGITKESVADAITIRTADEAEWPYYDDGTNGAVTVQLTATEYEILLKPGTKASRGLILHELGHALGYWTHSSQLGDVMYPQTAATAALATADVLQVLATPAWPLYADPNLCFVELTPEMNLVLPDTAGQTSHLRYLGKVHGRHMWVASSITENQHSQGCADSYVRQDGTLVLDDVRAQGQHYSAELAYIGENRWVLAVLAPVVSAPLVSL